MEQWNVPERKAVVGSVFVHLVGFFQRYVGTLDGLYQHTLIATETRLRPVEATFLGHILGTKPAKKYKGLNPFKVVLLVILGLLKFV